MEVTGGVKLGKGRVQEGQKQVQLRKGGLARSGAGRRIRIADAADAHRLDVTLDGLDLRGGGRVFSWPPRP